jgi:hypothetical protein
MKLDLNKLSGSRGVFIVLVGLALFITACAPSAPTREAAIQDSLRQGSRAVANFQVWQTMRWVDGEIVQYTFSAVDPDGKSWECEGVTFVRPGMVGWQAESSGQNCQDANGGSGTFKLVGSTGGGGTGTATWQVASGLITDSAAQEVRVTWSDSTTETVKLVNQAFLIMQPEGISVQKLDALTADGTIIDTLEFGPPIASKDEG